MSRSAAAPAPHPLPARYDPVARTLHWGNAVLAVVVILLAWCIPEAPRHGAARQWLLTLHMSLGLVLLAVMVIWGGWRLRHPAPSLWPALRRIEILLAHTAQAALYLLFVAMPLSGYVYLTAAGQRLNLFGIVSLPPPFAAHGRLAQAAIAAHLLGQLLIYVVVGLHVAAALVHGFIRRDGILERMLPPARGAR